MGVASARELPPDLRTVLLDEAALAQRVGELAGEIARDYASEPPLLLGVLTGAFVFLADLARALPFPVEIAFLKASSYGREHCSSGQVLVQDEVGDLVRGRHVILVEDIVDTGRTLACLMERLRAGEAASVAVCCLLDKPARREVPVEVQYCGFSIPNEFVVGYGLDYAGRFRSLPYVAIVKPEAYAGQAE